MSVLDHLRPIGDQAPSEIADTIYHAGPKMRHDTKVAASSLLYVIAQWAATDLQQFAEGILREVNEGAPAVLDELFATMGPALAEMEALVNAYRLANPVDDTAQQMSRAIGAVRQAFDGAVAARRSFSADPGTV
ncbi:hypothetical protein OJ997_27700 [Solirubrobacter phytolaccae]|uniref:Uncharacterized protein n=1 Tax=Solirubrobacter phytolaccae TaxID=1404360 RepID=A0A9X3NFM5_9ACTN|nr:hypothetical protein [Solirubrobacter phytolaccae]MDA0184125.1 hypothetical protein [Solirubrobacter phytolaccae]